MAKNYTTAFIGITLSGEIYVIRQHKDTSLVRCALWRLENKEEIERLWGPEIETVTLKRRKPNNE